MGGSPGSTAVQLKRTIDTIGALDWSSSARAHSEAARIFDGLDTGSLRLELRDHAEDVIDPGSSHEKTTHYKWFVAADPHDRFRIWLHEYKPKHLRRVGHAAVPHNHRFWLSSLILRGGFTDSRFERVRRPREDTDWIGPADSRVMSSGDTMVVAPDEIHALSDLQDETVSLIVEGKAIRSYSEVFENGVANRYYDLEAKLASFQASL